jgi:hypothetical protein
MTDAVLLGGTNGLGGNGIEFLPNGAFDSRQIHFRYADYVHNREHRPMAIARNKWPPHLGVRFRKRRAPVPPD